MKNICPKCGQPLRRSNDISVHFHAHVTEISRESGMPRNQVYWTVLLKAVEIGTVDGGGYYPYTMVETTTINPITGGRCKLPAVHPVPTSQTNNKQMMTAVEACHVYAAEQGITLTEKCERCKGTGILNGHKCTFCEGSGKEYI